MTRGIHDAAPSLLTPRTHEAATVNKDLTVKSVNKMKLKQ